MLLSSSAIWFSFLPARYSKQCIMGDSSDSQPISLHCTFEMFEVGALWLELKRGRALSSTEVPILFT